LFIWGVYSISLNQIIGETAELLTGLSSGVEIWDLWEIESFKD